MCAAWMLQKGWNREQTVGNYTGEEWSAIAVESDFEGYHGRPV